MTLDRTAGVLLRPDGDGWLHRPKLRPDLDMIEGALDEVAAYLGTQELGRVEVLVRGSAARGALRAGVSDLDIVILMERVIPATPRTVSWDSTTGPWSPVECEFYRLDELNTERFWYVEQMLCLEAVHVAGAELHPPSQRVYFGPNLIFNARVLGARMDSIARNGFTPAASAWAAKSLIRAAFETVMDEAGGFTRDLAACCRAINDVLPVAAPGTWVLAESFIEGHVDAAQLAAVHDMFRERIELTLERAGVRAREDIRRAGDKNK